MPPLLAGSIRQQPEDFQVFECPLIEPCGHGEHLWLKLRKTDWTTQSAARVLTRWAGITQKSVSFAGQKDRNAVTEQWFSLHLPGKPDPDSDWDWPSGLQVLQTVRHDRKLKTGALLGNDFVLRVRDCQGDRGAVEARLDLIAVEGVPNYFGEQRFGRYGDNYEKAARFLKGRKRIKDRDLRGLMISSARSWIFNHVLASRVNAQCWNQPLQGDLLMLNGSHSLFSCDLEDEEIIGRVSEGDLHPTGPLAGDVGQLVVENEADVLERAQLEDFSAVINGLRRQRVAASRRPLRVIPERMRYRWIAPDDLEISFHLPAGSYATAVLRELLHYQGDLSAYSA